MGFNSPGDMSSLLMSFVGGMLYFRSLRQGNEYIGYKLGGENLDDIILNSNSLSGFFARGFFTAPPSFSACLALDPHDQLGEQDGEHDHCDRQAPVRNRLLNGRVLQAEPQQADDKKVEQINIQRIRPADPLDQRRGMAAAEQKDGRPSRQLQKAFFICGDEMPEQHNGQRACERIAAEVPVRAEGIGVGLHADPEQQKQRQKRWAIFCRPKR